MNVKFTISYDGTVYKGSQRQPSCDTVEDKFIEAFRYLNVDAKIVLSGRTDKDVHATGQVFNTVLPEYLNDFPKLNKVLNKMLPDSIKVRSIVRVDDEFHSRFHAKYRVYRYIITTKPTTPFNSKYLTYVPFVNEELIKEAIKEFIGVFDFEYFHKRGSDKENLVREIFNTSFYKYKDIYVFKFTANSYLRSQIRLMVGFLLEISKGKLSIEDLKMQLARKKHLFKIPAKPYGLYLAKIKY